ncbi:MAG: hypothetical protein GY821_16690 [Gammaproteobacteria bacterium]|nr:hypothetical protein [Gammaproteobacteria bacterium]
MSYIPIKKRRYCLGINSTAVTSEWILLQKTRDNIQVVNYGNDSNVLQQIKYRHAIYTAVTEQQIIKKSLPMNQPLSDQQIMLQLQLSADNLFNAPLATLAIDFYYSSAQQLTIFAVRQSIINQIVQYLARHHLHATAIEPKSQALQRIANFYALGTDTSLFIHLASDGFYLLSCNDKTGKYCHYHPWSSPSINQEAVMQLTTALQQPDNYTFEEIVVSGSPAIQFTTTLRQLLNVPIANFNPLVKIGGKHPDNPGAFTLAVGLALRGIFPYD